MTTPPPRVALLVATDRGARVLERVLEYVVAHAPGAQFLVCSFPEAGDEPRYLARIRGTAAAAGAVFLEARDVAAARHRAAWDAFAPDLLLAVSWRYLVPPAVYARAARGAFVFHDSLLPAYRGFAPTVWAMLNGERETGATLFAMDEGVDEGAIVGQTAVPIAPDDTIAEVGERVTRAYLALLDTHLPGLLAGTAPRRPQDHARATYTCRRLPEDNRVDWAAPPEVTLRLVRAATRPYPGAFTTLDGVCLRIWRARSDAGAPRYVGRVAGRVVGPVPGGGVRVLAGDGSLVLERVQRDGDAEADAAVVLTSTRTTLGR